jgi:hypothetical protein
LEVICKPWQIGQRYPRTRPCIVSFANSTAAQFANLCFVKHIVLPSRDLERRSIDFTDECRFLDPALI